jgi:hypothetical protein
VIPVRVDTLPTLGSTRVLTIAAGHPLVGAMCPACDERLERDARVVLVLVGPGPDAEDQKAAREGRWHTGAAVTVHALCAGLTADR